MAVITEWQGQQWWNDKDTHLVHFGGENTPTVQHVSFDMWTFIMSCSSYTDWRATINAELFVRVPLLWVKRVLLTGRVIRPRASIGQRNFVIIRRRRWRWNNGPWRLQWCCDSTSEACTPSRRDADDHLRWDDSAAACLDYVCIYTAATS